MKCSTLVMQRGIYSKDVTGMRRFIRNRCQQTGWNLLPQEIDQAKNMVFSLDMLM